MDHKNLIMFTKDNVVEHVATIPVKVLDGEPRTNVWRNFVHPGGKMQAGVWDCQAGTFELSCHTSTEMCVIIEGEATIENAAGELVEVKAGDAFIIPQGMKNIWHVQNYVKKYYLCVVDL